MLLQRCWRLWMLISFLEVSLEHLCSTPSATFAAPSCAMPACASSSSSLWSAIVYFFAVAICSWRRCRLLRNGYLVIGRCYQFSSQWLPGRWLTWSPSPLQRLPGRCGWILCPPQWLPSCLWMKAELSIGGCFATTASPTLYWRPLHGCIFLWQA